MAPRSGCGPRRCRYPAGSVFVAIVAVGRDLGVREILLGRPAEERTVSAQTTSVAALPEAVAAVIDPHVVAEVADRSKMEAVDVERWRPRREAFDEVRSCAAVSRGDSHRRSMGGCWKDQMLPDSERPPALSRERCADDGRSGGTPFFRRVANDAARHPSVICRPRSLPARSSTRRHRCSSICPCTGCDACGDVFRLPTSRSRG